MKDNSKALFDFMKSSMSVVLLMALVAKVITCLKNHVFFASLAAKLTALEDYNDEFIAALKLAQTGTAAQKKALAEMKPILQGHLKEVCKGVNYLAGGNRPMLMESGFNLSKEFRTNIVLGPITNLVVDYGINAGEMICSFDRQPGIKGVNYDWTDVENPNDQTRWETINCGDVKCIVKGLTPGKKFTVRVSISGPRNQVVYSSMVSKIVGSGLSKMAA